MNVNPTLAYTATCDFLIWDLVYKPSAIARIERELKFMAWRTYFLCFITACHNEQPSWPYRS